ncbi:MAG: hypothetical protein QM790_00055 [Nibricoccus sp.]
MFAGLVALLFITVGCATTKRDGTQTAIEKLSKSLEATTPLSQQVDLKLRADERKANEDLQVRRILERWIKIQGGSERLALLRGVHNIVSINDGRGTNFISTYEGSGGRYRYELVGAEAALCGGFDGATKWQKDGLWGAILKTDNPGIPYWHSQCLLSSRLDQVFPKRRLLGEKLIQGQVCQGVALTSTQGLEERWYFDVRSGFLVQVERKVFSMQDTVFRYSDYANISRVLMPKEITVTEPQGARIVYRIVSTELMVTGTISSFSPPEVFLADQTEIDELLKRSLSEGYGKQTEGRSSVAYANLFSPSTGSETKLKVYRRKPGYVLVEKESAGVGRTVCGYDGSAGWENSEILGYHVLKEAEINDLFSLSWLGCDPFLRERFPLRTKVGVGKVGDREVVNVGLRTANGLSGVFSFDRENARLLSLDMQENPTAGFQALKIEYSDYRAVDTLVLPFRVQYHRGGVDTIITCDKVDLDVDLPDALFHPRTDVD